MKEITNVIISIIGYLISIISYYFFINCYNVEIDYYNSKYPGKEIKDIPPDSVTDLYGILCRLRLFRILVNIFSILSMLLLIYITIYVGVVIFR